MSEYVNRAGLQVASVLADFVESRALAGTGISPEILWSGLASLLERFVPINQSLLRKRDALQAQLDDWHIGQSRADCRYGRLSVFLTRHRLSGS